MDQVSRINLNLEFDVIAPSKSIKDCDKSSSQVSCTVEGWTTVPLATKERTTKPVNTDGDSLQLPPPVQTFTTENWRATGAKPTLSGVTQAQAATTVTSSTNARLLLYNRNKENSSC